MKYVISRYNHETSWISEYSSDVVMYDRSDTPLANTIQVPNIGSDIYDKLTFIIDNYDSLPDVAVYTKANLFKYITKEEWDEICNNTTFTPILTKNHEEKMIDLSQLNPEHVHPDARRFLTEPLIKKYSFYDEDGMYNELNTFGYINVHPCKTPETKKELAELLGIWDKDYVTFAPGSNYILPKENILKHPKEFYQKLRSYLEWNVYPGEAMIIERGLYNIWK